jgi:hypothetical protein
MNTMYRCTLAALIAAVVMAPAAAQVQRVFPPNALRGAIVMSDPPDITLNGKAARLSPGVRIRNQSNMLQLTGTLAGQRLLVNYTLENGTGLVNNVWVLRPDEAAVRPWPTTPEEAQSWTFDPTTQTWTKP